MADWRIGKGWSQPEIRRHFEQAGTLDRNFDADPAHLQHLSGWYTYASHSLLGRGPTGPPSDGGPFQRACKALRNYDFSDGRIVRAYFDEGTDLLGRSMLLEIRAFRAVRFLAGVRVGAVTVEQKEHETVFGFRYDTLEGHIERGAEWFILRKEHASGIIDFRISACWQRGEFPNWWSRIGFELVGRHYQKKWHRRAHDIMAAIVDESALPETHPPTPRTFSPNVVFEERTQNA